MKNFSSYQHYLNLFQQFKRFLGPQVRSYLILSFFTGILWFGGEAVFLLFIQAFLTSLELITPPENMFTNLVPKTVLGTLSLLIVFGFFRTLISIFHSYTQGMCGEVFIRIQRSRVLEVGLTNAHKINSAEILNTFNDKILESSSAVLLISSFFHILTSTLFLFFLGFKLAPRELLLGLLILIALLLPFSYLNKKMRSYGEDMMKKSDQVTNIIVTGLKNFFFLKVYNLTSRELSKGKKILLEREKTFGRFFIVSSLSSSIPFFLGSIVISIITFVSLKYWHTEKMVLLSFFYIFIRISQSLNQVSGTIASFNVYYPILSELMRWTGMYEKHRTVNEPIDSTIAQPTEVNLKISKISFSYESVPVLKDISVELKTSEVLLIQGESGSGKSTLLALILGILKPLTGDITINGEDVSTMEGSLSSFLAYSGPEPYLIAGTMRENLLYAHPWPKQVTEEQMLKSLRRAHMDELGADILNVSFHELTELSSGQKQRLSLARAFLRNPKLLVLDEATSHIDSRTEKAIFSDLKEYLPEMTTVIVSHRGDAKSIATKHLELPCFSFHKNMRL